jgi:hypothetical protein
MHNGWLLACAVRRAEGRGSFPAGGGLRPKRAPKVRQRRNFQFWPVDPDNGGHSPASHVRQRSSCLTMPERTDGPDGGGLQTARMKNPHVYCFPDGSDASDGSIYH